MSDTPAWLTALARRVRALLPSSLRTGLEPFEFETEGPELDDHPPVPVTTILGLAEGGTFESGWYTRAFRAPIHPGRIGPAITPRAVGLHTTDMRPGTFRALLAAWAKGSGSGAGAHFLIGKTADDGIAQLAPIYRNGNHMGGSTIVNGKRVPNHGWFKTEAGALIHPNTCTVGVEVDNAGKLARRGGGWIHPDTGTAIPAADVFIDERGGGWERWTTYQVAQTVALVRALDAVMPRFAGPVAVVPNVRKGGTHRSHGVPWAALTSTRVVFHAQLDPARKSDPGPQIVSVLRELGMI